MLFGTGLFHLVSERKRNDHRSAHIVDMARALVDNLKIGDIPQFNWDDEKITFTAWRMAVEKLMLASSNISVREPDLGLFWGL